MSNQVIQGDCLEVLRTLPDSSVDSVVTDPPYGLAFMNKKWDYDVPTVYVWREVLRVLKPGGHLLCFAGTRTYHRMVVNIEDAGFEIRDQIGWLYGSGFPKSMDVSKAIDKAAGATRTEGGREWSGGKRSGGIIKDDESEVTSKRIIFDVPATEAARQWNGWGTALKPAWEPICLARKPFTGTVADNVLEHGTGAINIDASRVPLNGDYKAKANGRPSLTGLDDNYDPAVANQPDDVGRFPANVIHDGSDEVLSTFPDAPGQLGHSIEDGAPQGNTVYGAMNRGGPHHTPRKEDNKSASRFFYCAKAAKKERGEGNTHPTVKPMALMTYLVTLVTPPNGVLLDPFAGSGTTLLAAKEKQFRYIGIEKEGAYIDIINKRLEEEHGS